MSISASSQVELIPRKIIFGNPDKANVQVSKDGKYISYLSNRDGVLNIFVSPTRNNSFEFHIQHILARCLEASYTWLYTVEMLR